MKYLILILLFPYSCFAQSQEIDERIRQARIYELNQQENSAYSIYNQIYDDCLAGKIFCPGASKLFLSQKTKRVENSPPNEQSATSITKDKSKTLNANWALGAAVLAGAVAVKYLKDNHYEIDFMNYTIQF